MVGTVGWDVLYVVVFFCLLFVAVGFFCSTNNMSIIDW